MDCQYDDAPLQRLDSSGGSREIITRLRDIESTLQYHLPGLTALVSGLQAVVPQPGASGTSPRSQTSAPSSTLQAARSLTHDMAGAVSPWPPMLMSIDSQSEVTDLPPLTIPIGHKTSSNYLLRLPVMKQLIGEYPDDLFFLLEARNSLPPEMTLYPNPTPLTADELDKEVLDCLVSAYFSQAYHCHPILDRDDFQRIYQDFHANGTNSWSIESMLCLVVFALGAATLAPPGGHASDSSPPGMIYMQAALPTLMSMSSWSFNYSLLLPQSLMLASLYFAYIIRPLQSWRLVYLASSLLQFRLCRYGCFLAIVTLALLLCAQAVTADINPPQVIRPRRRPILTRKHPAHILVLFPHRM